MLKREALELLAATDGCETEQIHRLGTYTDEELAVHRQAFEDLILPMLIGDKPNPYAFSVVADAGTENSRRKLP